jgi:hypothetical protein
LGCGASESAPSAVLPVTLHTLPDCDVPARLSRGSIELLALGDFEATNDSVEVLPINADTGDAARGTALKFPLATRAIEARLDAGELRFSGYGERSSAGRFDVLLWPGRRTCSVFRPDGPHGYPGKGGGQALGFARGRGLMLSAGGNDALVSNSYVGAISFDVRTGAVTSFDTSQDSVLREARAFATVSELGDKLLIAGGQHPAQGVAEEDLDLSASAELFDPELGTLVGAPIALRNARTRHAAVTLRNGASLLIGGRSRVNDSPLTAFAAELISPETGLSKPTVTPAPRIDPRALVLSDGRVFVGGGTTFAGEPAEPGGEWISSDGLSLLGEADIPPRFERAFVATAGGGVLAVGGCQNREPESKEEAVQCGLECARGCRPLPENGGKKAYDAHWIDPDGIATPVGMDAIVAGRPILLPGSDGRPWLVAEHENEPGKPRLFRFDPWQQRFDLADLPEDLRLPRPDYPQPVAIDPDAFVWVDDDGKHGELFGLRLGTRNRYTQDLALVLLFDPEEPTRPLHLAPDRPLREPERYDGKLWLYPRSDDSALTVLVADADYGDVSITLRLAQPKSALDIPESSPPLVVLGNAPFGGEQCPWPSGSGKDEERNVLTLARRGTRVELRRNQEIQTCSVPAGRLTLGLRVGEAVSVIEQLDVTRGAAIP